MKIREWLVPKRRADERPWLDCLVLAAITVALLGMFWIALPARFQANQNYDYTCCYETVARNWIAGNGFIYPNGNFASAYPPGFPVLLAGVFLLGKLIGEGFAMSIFIGLCDVVAVLAVYWTGRAIGGVWVARVAGLALITYPFFLWMSKQPNSEGPFLPLVLWGFYGYVRLVADNKTMTTDSPSKWAAFTGACWALASLMRPIAMLGGLVVAASVILFSKKQILSKRIVLAGLLMAVNLATLLPWEIIARERIGRWILVGDNSGTGYFDGLTFGLPGVALHPAAVGPDVRELMQRAAAQPDRIRSTGGFLGFLKEEAQAHPVAFLKLVYIKATRVWYGTFEGYFEGINKLVELIYIVVAGIGLWWMRGRMRAEALGILAVVGYFWFMAALVNPILRYMVPSTALLMFPVAVMLTRLAGRWLPARVSE
jgi:4-amino-4-deoxy-L-arabinose transferase-like glycosyltransferase